MILLFSVSLNNESLRTLIVWNVGQGQWVTLIEGETCWHFDAGGERAPWSEIRRACRERDNRFAFSHWDWDHISFAGRVNKYLPRSCMDFPPQGGASARKQRALAGLRGCNSTPTYASWIDSRARTENEKSRVFYWRGILIPGDSTSHEERYWSERLAGVREARLLILGHHGSRTSTSRLLLTRVPHLLVAIASARRAKYGHPHSHVRANLRAFRVPLLTTEDWGTLVFEY